MSNTYVVLIEKHHEDFHSEVLESRYFDTEEIALVFINDFNGTQTPWTFLGEEIAIGPFFIHHHLH